MTRAAGRSVDGGRRWIVSPADSSVDVTDPDELYEAIAAALIHRALHALSAHPAAGAVWP
ncbi:hypothetical protein [Streptomyces sp. NPDC053726]|uniref:hypothetical protein n=1 Tax=Streptomyces sp. NPDC053726 TaxID=3365713 RepID=UPI0037D162F1